MTTQQEKEIAELIAEKDAIEKELAELAVWFEHCECTTVCGRSAFHVSLS